VKFDCLDVYIAANAVHTVFMMQTEIGYGLRKLFEEKVWKKKLLGE